MQDTFFSFRHFEMAGGLTFLSSACTATGEASSFAAAYLADAIKAFPEEGHHMELILSLQLPDAVIRHLGKTYNPHPECYAIVTSPHKQTLSLYALTHRGLIYAVSTLIQLMQGDGIPEEMFLFDYPDMDLRGYRVYTPGRAFIPTFKAMIDKLVYYKYNTVMIEVGGAMEYKRRPEINENWVAFCSEISVSPDTADRIQRKTYPWRKDSIHFDNGNGGFISQEEMRDIIAYCEERELTVIPEVPSLSHADYIVRAYPELNERVEDAYPDTYCPSNPKTYEVLFDIIDEVAEVFQPAYINIGHDEYYTSAKCPLCREKSPVDLYVGDIIRINDYLKTKGIKAMMWADKFFGGPDGNGEPAKDVPNLIGCRGKVPTDVTLLNWAWPTADHSQEQLLHGLGYRMLFGNFDAISRPNYRTDAHLHGGGFVSNWGSCEEVYMQRNYQNFWLANTAYIFWSPDYTDADRPALLEKIRKELYGAYKRSLGGSVIELCHTTDIQRKYAWFFDGRFIVDSDWLLGHHTLRYTDGTTASLPVIFGCNIRSSLIENFETNVSGEAVEAVGAAYPFLRDGKIWYRTAYQNPYPEKEIEGISPAPNVFLEKEYCYESH